MSNIEQIRRAHKSARPTTQNPAWMNCHHDCGVLLEHIAALEEESRQWEKTSLVAIITERDALKSALRSINLICASAPPCDELDEEGEIYNGIIDSIQRHVRTGFEPGTPCVCSSRASQIRIGETHMPDCPRYEPNRNLKEI